MKRKRMAASALAFWALFLFFRTALAAGPAPVWTADGEALKEQRENPVIFLEEAAPLGEAGPFAGSVCREDGGSFDPALCQVSLYVELEEWHTFWPKPDLENPTVPLSAQEPDGEGRCRRAAFSVSCDPQIGSDRTAEKLHLFLVPAGFVPTMDMGATEAVCLDHVVVERRPAEAVRITPLREHGTEGSEEAFAAFPSLAGVFDGKPALDVGFYRRGAPGGGLAQEEIREVLQALLPFAGAVRFYGSAGELAPAYAIAGELGLPVIGTAWLSGETEKDKEELAALIRHCREGRCILACVGSETLLRNDLTPQELAAYLDFVRRELAGTGIPVTTAEDAGKLLEHRELAEACDILMPNIHPYWAGVDACAGAGYLAAAAGLLSCAYPGKEIIVSETGWPAGGGGNAGEKEAFVFYEKAMAWAREAGIPILWFSACDEAWKRASEGEAGAHWGILDGELRIKECFRRLPAFGGRAE